MGAAESASVLRNHGGRVERLIGDSAIGLADNFWDELLSFSNPLTKIRASELDESIGEWFSFLVRNSPTTGHIPKLLIHVAKSLRDVSSDKPPLKAMNAVFFSRMFLKHLCQNHASSSIVKLLELHVSPQEAESFSLPTGTIDVASHITEALIQFVAFADVNATTYVLHVEVINMLIVLCSTQLESSNFVHPFIDCIMANKDLSGPVVRKLLLAYIVRLPVPVRAPMYLTNQQQAGQAGVLRKVGSAAAAVFLLPYYTYTYLLNPNLSRGGKSPLADSALLLLLLLIHQSRNDHLSTPANDSPRYPSTAGCDNPYRTAVASLEDDQFGQQGASLEDGATVSVPFAALFDTLGQCLMDDQSTLLLYTLIHSNSAFLDYVLVRADLDTVLMPMLEMLYKAPQQRPNQIYMLLIILLILTQDASFNANVHKLIVASVPWYKERLLTRTPLGSLMVVVLIRTVKYNLSRLRDVYLHTNCLAALANMAPHVHQLTSYASQRLISLFQMLAKKYMRLVDSRQLDTVDVASATEEAGSSDAVPSELHIYNDFLRIVLEILNAILTYALPRNPEVVYALLHRQEIFIPFQNHPQFYELLENISMVIDFFNAKMDSNAVVGEWSVEKVLEIIVSSAKYWRGDSLKMFTELRFTYEEELHPEEFFVPYVWTLIVEKSNIPWNTDGISLFPSKSTEELEEIFDQEAIDATSELSPTIKSSNIV